MKKVLLTTAYLPPVQYFAKLYSYDEVWVEQHDHYVKQTYRNRCVIAAPEGSLALTVPVEKWDGDKCLMRDIRISDHGRWQHLHWQALVSAYRTSPFFEYYMDDFRPFYEQKFTFLLDFNEALMAKICELLDMPSHICRTTTYGQPVNADDFRERIHPKRGFADDEAFRPMPYYQVFAQRNGFLPNLSIVDLLFCMGPEGLLVLRECVNSKSEI